jgi:acidic leucine-rich nuclear phosphoprotein 32 family member B
MNLYKELQEKLTEHNPTEVDELILDDIFEDIASFTESNRKDLEKYVNLVHLSLNGFGLESLKNFPKIPSLNVLEIRSNKLNGTDFAEITKLYPSLYKLKVGDNPIKSLDVFKFLKGSSIKKIELDGCPAISGNENYRDDVFKLAIGLEIVDNMTKEGEYASTTNYEEDDEDEFDDGDEDDEDLDDEEGEYDEEDEDEEGENDESDK